MFPTPLQIVRHVWRFLHVLTFRPEIQEALSRSGRNANEFAYHIYIHRWMAQDEITLGGAGDLCIATMAGGLWSKLNRCFILNENNAFVFIISLANSSNRFNR